MMRRFIAHALSPVLLLALGILCAAERPAHATCRSEARGIPRKREVGGLGLA